MFRDVNIYGPGAVIRTKRPGYEAGATALVTRDMVVTWAQDPMANSAPFALPDFHSSSGYGLVAEGSNVASAKLAYEVKAKLDSQRTTTMNVTFGNTRVLNPFGEAQLRGLVREHRKDFDSETITNIKHGTSAIVLQAYYCDGLTYTFTQDGNTNVDLNTALGGKELAKLSANGFRIINNRLTLNEPVFIGYTPLPNAAELLTAN